MPDVLQVIALAMREVGTIISVNYNSGTSLPLASEWDGTQDINTTNYVPKGVCALFGNFYCLDYIDGLVQTEPFQLKNNQIFVESDFRTLVAQLQAGYGSSGAPMAVLDLTTVENSWWGIPAGRTIKLVVMINYKWDMWQDRLPADTTVSIANGTIACEHATNNEFTNRTVCGNSFPEKMPKLYGSSEQMNLMSQMSSAMVLENKNLFCSIIGGCAGPSRKTTEEKAGIAIGAFLGVPVFAAVAGILSAIIRGKSVSSSLTVTGQGQEQTRFYRQSVI